MRDRYPTTTDSAAPEDSDDELRSFDAPSSDDFVPTVTPRDGSSLVAVVV
jgi:hypothetical protein